MAKVRRNEQCPCGSGLKAKRCCLAADHAKVTTPRATLAQLQTTVVGSLRDDVDREDFEELVAEMMRLPELDMSLQVVLPVLETPEIARARLAFDDGNYDRLDEILENAAVLVDTPQHRLDLARAVLAQRDAGHIDPKVAAVAVLDLNQSRSTLLMSALAHAIAVANGNNETPLGLLAAAR